MYLPLSLALIVLLSDLTLNYAFKDNNNLRFHFGKKNINFQLSIEVFQPKGIKVSIPHKDGLEIFSFHGNVNSPHSDSGGDRNGVGYSFSHDVTSSLNGEWVYENKDIQLELGDVLNFWVFLQYRGAGQRFNDLSHVVKKLSSNTSSLNPVQYSYQSSDNGYKEKQTVWRTTHAPISQNAFQAGTTTKLPLPILSNNYVTHPTPQTTNTQCGCKDEYLKDVWSQLNATLAKMRTLEQNITPLEEKLNSLTETVVELIKHMDIGTKLLLTGNLPSQTNPVEDVRHLIVEKLKLFDLSTTILQAEYKKNGILFEVSSSVDKLRILKRSNDVLSKLSYQIIDPEKPIFDVRMARK